MKKIHVVLLVTLCTLFTVPCLAQKFCEDIDCQILVQSNDRRCNQVDLPGITCLRVVADHKTRERVFDLAKKFAVIAVMLRGVPGGITANPLLSTEEQEKHRDFVRQFFDGEYRKYVQHAEVVPDESFKIKGGFRLAVDIQVNYESLAEYLIGKGYKRGLNGSKR